MQSKWIKNNNQYISSSIKSHVVIYVTIYNNENKREKYIQFGKRKDDYGWIKKLWKKIFLLKK